MTLTACGEDEFTCFDGSCISMDGRCDGRENCPDASDEKECLIIKTFDGYNKILLPPPTGSDLMFTLNISIFISKIIQIDEINGKLKTKLNLVRSWFNPQLRYLNLQRHEARNILSSEDRERIWLPLSVFQNVDQVEEIMMTDRADIVKIVPNQGFQYERGSKYDHLNTRVFDGSENAINYDRELTINSLCDFDVAWFPFDSQVCFLQIYHDQQNIALRPVAVNYTGSKKLSQHFVKSVKICNHEFDEKPGIVVEVHFGRPLVGSILTIFLPTIILVILSQMVEVYANDYIDMVISVNLTILLVLATM